MDALGEIVKTWLNPINLGFFLVCAACAVWVVSRSGDSYSQK